MDSTIDQLCAQVNEYAALGREMAAAANALGLAPGLSRTRAVDAAIHWALASRTVLATAFTRPVDQFRRPLAEIEHDTLSGHGLIAIKEDTK